MRGGTRVGYLFIGRPQDSCPLSQRTQVPVGCVANTGAISSGPPLCAHSIAGTRPWPGGTLGQPTIEEDGKGEKSGTLRAYSPLCECAHVCLCTRGRLVVCLCDAHMCSPRTEHRVGLTRKLGGPGSRTKRAPYQPGPYSDFHSLSPRFLGCKAEEFSCSLRGRYQMSRWF